MLFKSCQSLNFFQSLKSFKWKFFIAIAVIISGCSESLDSIQQRIVASEPPPSRDRNSPQYYELKSKSVYDGDTFWVINPITQEEIKIRMACIDAPEKKQDLGIASRDYLRSLLNTNPEKLVVMKKEKDRYGRTVAEVFIPTGKGDEEVPVNEMMIKSGMAYYYSEYSKNCEDNATIYANLEKEAQRSRLGVWKNPNSVKPSEFRKMAREK
jgi:endonuclease YncB( thermonuclease family)